MSYSSFSNVAEVAAPALLTAHTELVRGTDEHFVAMLLPRVEKESIALNLANIERIDAAGIAALITLYCTACKAGTDFSIVTPSAHVLDLLRIVGLESILVAEYRSASSIGAQRCRNAA
jgi:anti-anti-sigma factor